MWLIDDGVQKEGTSVKMGCPGGEICVQGVMGACEGACV